MVTTHTAPGVYVEELPSGVRPLRPVPTGVCAFVGLTPAGPVHAPVALGSWADFERQFGGLHPGQTLGLAVQQFFAHGGQQALVVRLPPGATAQSAWLPTTRIARQRREGIYALDAVEGFDLLCLPPPAPGRDFSCNTWARAAAYCRQRRAILLLDTPTTWRNRDTVLDGLTALRQAMGPMAVSNVAVYHPRLQVADPSDHRRTLVTAPSAAVAGVIARTDAQHGVWKAPAGTGAGLVGVQQLDQTLSSADMGDFNVAGLNCIRQLPDGAVVWGARTLDGADAAGSEWKYLPVRRLALLIENSVRQGTRWVVFEPNDEPLWAQLRASTGNFLQALWRQGAMMGTKPEEAFFVRCDRSTMTAADFASGTLRLVIGFAPLKPAEFVVVHIALRAAV